MANLKNAQMKLNPSAILLDDYLELKTLTKGFNEWTEESVTDNPPRKVRLQRIRACMKCLGINVGDFQQFENGQWIEQVDATLVEKLQHILKDPFQLDYDLYITPQDSYSSMYSFAGWIAIRLAIYKLKSIRSGTLAASGHFLTPVFALHHLEMKLEKEQQAIDKVLDLLLNPKELRFDYETMVTDFGFPDVDLDEIDLDWM